MLTDRYGTPVTAASAEARDAYQLGFDLFLSAEAGVVEGLGAALELDPNMASAHLALPSNKARPRSAWQTRTSKRST